MVKSARFHQQLLLVILIVTFGLGCTDRRGGVPYNASAESLVEQGIAAAEKGDWETAIDFLTAGLESGRLAVDFVSQALVARARCQAALGKLDLASADLDEAEPGIEDVSELHAARGDLWLTRGDLKNAKAEYERARKLNPRIAIPNEIK